MTCDYPEVRVGDENAKADVESGIYTKHYQIKPTDTVLDIGAHVGYFSMWAASRCKRVIAVEPEPNNFKRLEDNTREFGNVMCLQYAATCGNSPLWLKINHDNSGGHTLFPLGKKGTSVLVNSINIGAYINALELSVDFAKIDVECAEYHVLSSLHLASIKCPMAIEMHNGDMFRECSRLLKSQGYTVIPEEPCVGVCYAMP